MERGKHWNVVADPLGLERFSGLPDPTQSARMRPGRGAVGLLDPHVGGLRELRGDVLGLWQGSGCNPTG